MLIAKGSQRLRLKFMPSLTQNMMAQSKGQTSGHVCYEVVASGGSFTIY
jgi:hypothetical protein